MADPSDECPRLELYRWYEGPFQIPAKNEVVQGPGRSPWCNSGSLWPRAWRCVHIEHEARGVRVGRLEWYEVLTGVPALDEKRAARLVRQARAGAAIRPTPAPSNSDVRYIRLRPPSQGRIVEAATLTVRRLCNVAWGDMREAMSLTARSTPLGGPALDILAARDEAYRLVEAVRLSGELVRRGEPPVWEIEQASAVSLELLQAISGADRPIEPWLLQATQERFEALNALDQDCLLQPDQVRYWKVLTELWTLCSQLGVPASAAKLDKRHNG